jgi:hypothetical protein
MGVGYGALALMGSLLRAISHPDHYISVNSSGS